MFFRKSRPQSGPAAPPLTWRASGETAAACLSLYWALVVNHPFLSAALHGRAVNEAATWGFGLSLVVMVACVHFVLLGLVSHRRTFKPLAALLTGVAALGTHFADRYGVYLDPSMIRNVVHTDAHEAAELIGWPLAVSIAAYALPPWLALWRLRLTRRPGPWARTLAWRGATVAAALVLLVGAALAVFQPLASLMRQHKELRYLITPANAVWSLGRVIATEARGAAEPRQPIGLDARPGPSWAASPRPRVLVVVVGETARAANWGLSGYARQTTPQLAARGDVINFTQVTSCGTNTEVSVPCMFAPVGRRDYDEARIRGSESLLHVLARAGAEVRWRDNQSGCKGVCDGLPAERVIDLSPPAGLCEDGRCFDEALLHRLDERIGPARGTHVIVLHEIGNHGPSYFRRHPRDFARFQPACEQDDLRLCSREQIVNAYDNDLLYTDDVLVRLIRKLAAQADRVDSALLYVSDHGESLGENNLFLHGIPYAIAPDVQKQVPMVMWFSPGFAPRIGLDTACLAQRAREPAAHDHLFHTVLGLLDVRTALHEPAWDLTAGCRKP